MINYNDNETVTISLERYEALKESSDKLNELQNMLKVNLNGIKICKFNAQCVLEELYYYNQHGFYQGGRLMINIIEGE